MLLPSSLHNQESHGTGLCLDPHPSLQLSLTTTLRTWLSWFHLVPKASLQGPTSAPSYLRNLKPVSGGKVKVLVPQSCPTICNPMDCSPPDSSVQGILRARILQWVWVAISFSRGSSQPRGQTWVSCIAGTLFTIWNTRRGSVSGGAKIPTQSIDGQDFHIYPQSYIQPGLGTKSKQTSDWKPKGQPWRKSTKGFDVRTEMTPSLHFQACTFGNTLLTSEPL